MDRIVDIGWMTEMATAVDIKEMPPKHRSEEPKNMPIARSIDELGTGDNHWQPSTDELMGYLFGGRLAALVWIAGRKRRFFSRRISCDRAQNSRAAHMQHARHTFPRYSRGENIPCSIDIGSLVQVFRHSRFTQTTRC